MPLDMTVRPPLTLPVIVPVTRELLFRASSRIVPGGDALGAIARQARGAVAVFQHLDGNLDEIAHLHFEFALIIQEFFERNIGFRFQAGIDHDEIVIDEHHFCSDDFALTHFLASQGFFK